MLVMFGLCVTTQALKTNLWSSQETVVAPTVFPDELWNTEWSLSTRDMFCHNIFVSIRRSISFILCCLPVLDCAAFAPYHFNFTMISLTVDQAIFSKVGFFINCLSGDVAAYNHAIMSSAVHSNLLL